MSLSLDKNFISNKEASELSGYSTDYIARLCREKKIEGSQIGRGWFVHTESLAKFIRQQEERKKEIARDLARSREEEYRARSGAIVPAIQTPVVKQTLKEPARAVVASPYVRSPRISTIHPALRSSFAVAVTVLVIMGASIAVESGSISKFANRVVGAALAINAQEQLLPEKTPIAFYRLGDALAHGTESTVVAAPQVYGHGLLALVSTPRDVSAAAPD